MKKNILLYILIIGFIGCSGDQKKIETLENKIDKLEKKVNKLVLDDKKKTVVEKKKKDIKNKNILNIFGKSCGGILREGPSRCSNEIKSLRQGEDVYILEISDEIMSGYNWFKIKTTSGIVGYQWGGILCSVGKYQKGLYKVWGKEPPYTK
jgi:hypothetical protein